MQEQPRPSPAGEPASSGSGPSSPSAAAEAQQLPNALRVIGMVSALAGITAAVALVYLVATSEELFFGSLVTPSDKAGYFVFAWVVFVVCGAQLLALITNHPSRILVSTLARIVTIIFPMFLTPTLHRNLSIGVESLIQLAANLGIAVTLLAGTRRPKSTGPLNGGRSSELPT